MNDIINENLILIDYEAKTKKEVLETISELFYKEGRLGHETNNLNSGAKSPKEIFLDSLLERENIFPTSVGFSFGIPHGKCNQVKKPSLAFIKLKKPVLWDKEENEMVEFVIAIGVSEAAGKSEHIDILTKLSRSILREDFRIKIKNAKDKKEIMDVLNFN